MHSAERQSIDMKSHSDAARPNLRKSSFIGPLGRLLASCCRKKRPPGTMREGWPRQSKLLNSLSGSADVRHADSKGHWDLKNILESSILHCGDELLPPHEGTDRLGKVAIGTGAIPRQKGCRSRHQLRAVQVVTPSNEWISGFTEFQDHQSPPRTKHPAKLSQCLLG